MGPEMLIQALDGVELGHNAESEKEKIVAQSQALRSGNRRYVLHHFKVTKFSGIEGDYTTEDVEEDDVRYASTHGKKQRKKSGCGCFGWLRRKKS